MARQSWRGRERGVKWVSHYSSAQTILVVGDGDLSFSLALAAMFGSGHNLVATSLDSYDALTSKYGQAESNVMDLKRLGATVLHGVNAKTMKRHPCLKMRRFDRIVFNFPHAGFIGQENDDHMIEAHQLLVRSFFHNASHLLCPGGEIHVSHKTGQPYDRWKIEELASEFSLVMFDTVAFQKEHYPGYNQKRGDSDRCNEEFSLHNGYTFKFRIEHEEAEEFAHAVILWEGHNCGFVEWVDHQWPPTVQNALLKLWAMVEDSKSARVNDNLKSALAIHHLTEEKNKVEANYDKLVQDVHELMNFQEERVLDFSYLQSNLTYQQQCRSELVADMKAKMAKKDAETQKLNQKYQLLVNLTRAQATVIQNLKLKHMKEKELLSEVRMNLELKNAELTKSEEKLTQEKLELKLKVADLLKGKEKHSEEKGQLEL